MDHGLHFTKIVTLELHWRKSGEFPLWFLAVVARKLTKIFECHLKFLNTLWDRSQNYLQIFAECFFFFFFYSLLLGKFSELSQVVQDGYEFFAQRGLVTIFSAPNYSRNWCCNAGVVMRVSPQLTCSFVLFKVDVTTLARQPVPSD